MRVRRYADGAAALLFVAGAVLHAPLAMAAAFIFLLAAVFVWLFETRGLGDVEFSQSVTPKKVFPGDPMECTTEVANAGAMPLSFLVAESDWPEEVTMSDDRLFVPGKPHRHTLELYFNVRPREIVRRKMGLVGKARGHYRLGPTFLRLSDPLGFALTERRYEDRWLYPEVTVYPRRMPVKVPPAFLKLGGTVRTPSLLDDPLLVRTLREWRPGDPARSIDWRATARRDDDLIVRERERVGEVEVSLFVNLYTARFPWDGTNPDYVEEVIETAAGLARELIQRKIAVGVYANGMHPGSGRGAALRPSSQIRHLEEVLTLLGSVEPAGRYVDLPSLMLSEARRRAKAATFLLLTPFLTPAYASALAGVRARGVRPIVVQFWDPEPDDPAAPPGVGLIRSTAVTA